MLARYLDHALSRRGFVRARSALGFTAAAATAVLEPLEASEEAAEETATTGAESAGSIVKGTGGELLRCPSQSRRRVVPVHQSRIVRGRLL